MRRRAREPLAAAPRQLCSPSRPLRQHDSPAPSRSKLGGQLTALNSRRCAEASPGVSVVAHWPQRSLFPLLSQARTPSWPPAPLPTLRTDAATGGSARDARDLATCGQAGWSACAHPPLLAPRCIPPSWSCSPPRLTQMPSSRSENNCGGTVERARSCGRRMGPTQPPTPVHQ